MKGDNGMTAKELLAQAAVAMDRAYVPYSKFQVGAALLGRSGKVYLGCNVENAAYGSTICAERTAILKAVSEGCREGWTAIAIAGRGEDYCWPCGACRQMLYEFAPELTVLVARADGQFVKLPLGELLPHGFGPANLD